MWRDKDETCKSPKGFEELDQETSVIEHSVMDEILLNQTEPP